jgi:hypothetical protein
MLLVHGLVRLQWTGQTAMDWSDCNGLVRLQWTGQTATMAAAASAVEGGCYCSLYSSRTTIRYPLANVVQPGKQQPWLYAA